VGVLHPDPRGRGHGRLLVNPELEHRPLAGRLPQSPQKGRVRGSFPAAPLPQEPVHGLLDPLLPPEHHVDGREGSQETVFLSLEPPRETFPRGVVQPGDKEKLGGEGGGIEGGVEPDEGEKCRFVPFHRLGAEPVRARIDPLQPSASGSSLPRVTAGGDPTRRRRSFPFHGASPFSPPAAVFSHRIVGNRARDNR